MKQMLILIAAGLMAAARLPAAAYGQDGGVDLLADTDNAQLGMQLLQEASDSGLSEDARAAILKDAQAVFTEAIHSDPLNPDLYFWRGAVRYRLGDLEGTDSDFLMSLLLRPVSIIVPLGDRLSVCRPPFDGRGCVWPLPNYCAFQDGDEAAKRAHAADVANKKGDEYMRNAHHMGGGWCGGLWARWYFDMAADSYEDAIGNDPDNPFYRLKHGWARLAGGHSSWISFIGPSPREDFEKAIEIFRKWFAPFCKSIRDAASNLLTAFPRRAFWLVRQDSASSTDRDLAGARRRYASAMSEQGNGTDAFGGTLQYLKLFFQDPSKKPGFTLSKDPNAGKCDIDHELDKLERLLKEFMGKVPPWWSFVIKIKKNGWDVVIDVDIDEGKGEPPDPTKPPKKDPDPKPPQSPPEPNSGGSCGGTSARPTEPLHSGLTFDGDKDDGKETDPKKAKARKEIKELLKKLGVHLFTSRKHYGENFITDHCGKEYRFIFVPGKKGYLYRDPHHVPTEPAKPAPAPDKIVGSAPDAKPSQTGDRDFLRTTDDLAGNGATVDPITAPRLDLLDLDRIYGATWSAGAHFRSAHTGPPNVLMCDGATRFIGRLESSREIAKLAALAARQIPSTTNQGHVSPTSVPSPVTSPVQGSAGGVEASASAATGAPVGRLP